MKEKAFAKVDFSSLEKRMLETLDWQVIRDIAVGELLSRLTEDPTNETVSRQLALARSWKIGHAPSIRDLPWCSNCNDELCGGCSG